MIEGISHITLVVSDLQRSAAMLEAVFAAVEVYDSGDEQFSLSREKFFLICGVWLVLMEGEPLPTRTYNHIAFKISEAEFENYAQRISEYDLEMKAPRTRVAGEGRSIYFYDYDNHLFELHTGTLAERLERYGVKTSQSV
ncbi:MAG: FosX/FosE/FosI family fosfomycin resistance hydrolase [Negativicutes bacterium]|jgi:catechol 2,3-dioxygenase-like lactoylglutathione lyase family enzyme